MSLIISPFSLSFIFTLFHVDARDAQRCAKSAVREARDDARCMLMMISAYAAFLIILFDYCRLFRCRFSLFRRCLFYDAAYAAIFFFFFFFFIYFDVQDADDGAYRSAVKMRECVRDACAY